MSSFEFFDRSDEKGFEKFTRIGAALAKISRRKAMQASIGGMCLALIAMFAAAFNHLTPSEGAITQEVIDLLAIFWALTTLKAR